MNERIREFLISENKSSAQLAEEIGVQPSGISHILSGRNNPSLDFVVKMLEKYPFLSTDWLLFGKGAMYREESHQKPDQTLFENVPNIQNDNNRTQHEVTLNENLHDNKPSGGNVNSIISSGSGNNTKSIVKKIVWFYDNNTFEEYFPG